MNRQTKDSRMGLRDLYCAACCLYTRRKATMYKPYYASTFSAIAALFINYYTLLVYIRQALFCHIAVIVKNRKPALYGWLLYLYNYSSNFSVILLFMPVPLLLFIYNLQRSFETFYTACNSSMRNASRYRPPAHLNSSTTKLLSLWRYTSLPTLAGMKSLLFFLCTSLTFHIMLQHSFVIALFLCLL